MALVSAALAGRRSAPGHPLERNVRAADAKALRELELCVSDLLTSGSSLGYPEHINTDPRSAWALDSLGYAQLALGWPERAARQHRLALRLRSSPKFLDQNGMTLDSAGASQTLLLLGLAEYSAGRPKEGSAAVDKLMELSILAQRKTAEEKEQEAELLLDSEKKFEVPLKKEGKNGPAAPKLRPPLSAEVATWLVSFAKTQTLPSARVRVQDFGVHLFERAFQLINGTRPATPATTALAAKHMQDYARFLFRLMPPRLEEAILVTHQALVLHSSTVGGGGDEHATASSFSMLGACHQRLGQATEATSFFMKAKETLESRLKKQTVPPKATQVLEVLSSYANVAATKFQAARTPGSSGAPFDEDLVKGAITDFRAALRFAKSFKLSGSHSRVRSLQHSLDNVLRIAHYQGMLGTCPAQKLSFIFGPTCDTNEETSAGH